MREWLGALALVLWLGVGGARAQPPPPMEVEAEIAAEQVSSTIKANSYTEVLGSPESEIDDGLRISVSTSMLSPARGYLPVQVLLHETQGRARAVDVVVRASVAGGAEVARRRVELGARQEVSAWLPVPVDVLGGLVRVTGPGLSPHTFSFYAASRNDAVLVLGSRQEFDTASGLSRVEDEGAMAVRFVVPTQAPRELASYVGFPVVVVTGEVTALPADVWSALEAYAAVGGRLVLFRPPRDVATRLPLLNEAVTLQGVHPHGFGHVRLCAPASVCGEGVLGDVAAKGGTLGGSVEPVRVDDSRRQQATGFEPLLPGVRAPVGRFLLLLSLFVLVVGPGGRWLVRRKGPVALLLAVPAVSFVTCLVMVLWTVFVDGLTLRSSLYSFTVLDRAHDRALTAALGAYYANLEPEGLSLSNSSVLLPPSQGDSSTAPLEIDWSRGPVVTGGFLPSRTYREWGELGLVPSRLRLAVRPGKEGPTVLNALGAPLLDGYLRWSGALWHVPALAEGAEGKAESVAEDRQEHEYDTWMPFGLSNRFSNDVHLRMRAPLSEGDFRVRLDGRGPFTALGSLDVALHQSVHVVVGQVDTL